MFQREFTLRREIEWEGAFYHLSHATVSSFQHTFVAVFGEVVQQGVCIDIYLAQFSRKEGQIGGKEDSVSSIVFQMRATIFCFENRLSNLGFCLKVEH